MAGDQRAGATPVPIPNTAVKPSRANGTAWATMWESRTSLARNNTLCVRALSEMKAPFFIFHKLLLPLIIYKGKD